MRNILYLAEHAPDPDKRRYAVEGEDIKHYMDIDHWGDIPHTDIPRDFDQALAKFLQIRAIQKNDTILIKSDSIRFSGPDSIILHNDTIPYLSYLNFVRYRIVKEFPAKSWEFKSDSISLWLNCLFDLPNDYKIHCIEEFSEHGINPYHIKTQVDQLSYAFMERDATRILKYSADLGHYISDCHVPLHATENYNGQLTGQHGIHAFWGAESLSCLQKLNTIISLVKPGIFGMCRHSHGKRSWKAIG